jgi:hypothetical protein
MDPKTISLEILLLEYNTVLLGESIQQWKKKKKSPDKLLTIRRLIFLL